MKKLKILYVEDIDKRLTYTIYELIKLENGYYKINNVNEIRNKPSDFFNNNQKKYCYVITLENSILESIYGDKIIILNQVLENLYKYPEKQNEKTKVKTFKKIY